MVTVPVLIFFSICEMSKRGIFSSTVTDHEVVFAVIGVDSVKHVSKIKDYRKLENTKSSVRAVFYLQIILQKDYTNNCTLGKKPDMLTNRLVQTIDENCPLITKKAQIRTVLVYWSFLCKHSKKKLTKHIPQRIHSTQKKVVHGTEELHKKLFNTEQKKWNF